MNPNKDFPRLDKYVRPEGIIAKLFAKDHNFIEIDDAYVLDIDIKYLSERKDRWRTQEEFLYNKLKGDCEDQSFFVQSVLLAKGIPCISVWKKRHMWNETYINNIVYERYSGNIFTAKRHSPHVMTKKMRTYRNVLTKKWWWARYDKEWYKAY